MTIQEVAKAINEDMHITIDSIEYIFVGYQLMKKDGQKRCSAILQETKAKHGLTYIPIEQIKND